MSILFISNSGECNPIAFRMNKEGAECKVYIHNPKYRKNYAGMLEIVPLKNLKKEVDLADLIIFDITKSNDGRPEDKALLKLFGLKPSSVSVFGPVATKLMKMGKKVVGNSAQTEILEMDRFKGEQQAEKIGFKIPTTHEFKTLKEGIKFLEGKSNLWVFKPDFNQDLDLTYMEKYPGELIQKMTFEYPGRVGDDIPYILQKVIKGTEIDCEGWYTGKKWQHFNFTIENKNLMNGNLGPHIGSQSNTVWIASNKNELIRKVSKMGPFLKKAGYVGPCDITTIVDSKGDIYFIELSGRLGYDAFYCLMELLNSKITDFFMKDFKGNFSRGFACSQRISIPPYPFATPTLLNTYAKDVTIDKKPSTFWMEDVYWNDGFKCAGSDGIIGVIAERGKDLRTAWGNTYKSIEELQISSYMQYRTDGLQMAQKRLNKLTKLGIF
jgi:phosphoribosylamine-glycine ligase